MSPSTSKRIFDFTLATFLSLLLLPLMMLVFLIIRISSRGPALYWSQRVGRNNEIFLMPKFRTMRTDTPQLATHLIESPDKWLVPCGSFLRKTSLDELPQLWSILKGDMSFVGPRPALYNQDDLIELRKKASIDTLMPGLTGWAQINGRDELPIPKKVELEVEYMRRMSFAFDLKILLKTVIKAPLGLDVTH